MVQRCTNPERNSYGLYGGRGIQVCARWQSFDNFLKDMGARPEGTSLGRIDPNGGYTKGNCEWQTAAQQSRSRTNNKLTESAAQAIRTLYAAGNVSQRQLGRAYNVSKTMIRNVVTGRAWNVTN